MALTVNLVSCAKGKYLMRFELNWQKLQLLKGTQSNQESKWDVYEFVVTSLDERELEAWENVFWKKVL